MLKWPLRKHIFETIFCDYVNKDVDYISLYVRIFVIITLTIGMVKVLIVWFISHFILHLILLSFNHALLSILFQCLLQGSLFILKVELHLLLPGVSKEWTNENYTMNKISEEYAIILAWNRSHSLKFHVNIMTYRMILCFYPCIHQHISFESPYRHIRAAMKKNHAIFHTTYLHGHSWQRYGL